MWDCRKSSRKSETFNELELCWKSPPCMARPPSRWPKKYKPCHDTGNISNKQKQCCFKRTDYIHCFIHEYLWLRSFKTIDGRTYCWLSFVSKLDQKLPSHCHTIEMLKRCDESCHIHFIETKLWCLLFFLVLVEWTDVLFKFQ